MFVTFSHVQFFNLQHENHKCNLQLLLVLFLLEYLIVVKLFLALMGHKLFVACLDEQNDIMTVKLIHASGTER
uniref:Uncharacterized protein n=1 Tax=Solanum lycopersicum TaxID=4081 RepID=A0A3Q7FM53_SOLLC